MILSVRLDVWLVGHELANGKQFAALTYIWLKPPVYRHLFLTSSLWLVWNYVKLMLGLFDVPFSHDKSCDGTDFSTFYNNPSMIIPAIWWYYSNPYCYTSRDHPIHCNSTFPIPPRSVPSGGSCGAAARRFPCRHHPCNLAVFLFALTWPWHQQGGIMW